MFKNIMYSGGTFFSKMVLQLGVFSLFAHIYATEQFAIISLAFALSWAITNISDFGFRTKLVKDFVICADEAPLISLLQTSDTIKVLLFVILFLLSIAYIFTFGLSEYFLFFIIYSIAALFLTLANGRFAILQAKEHFYSEFIINVISVILYLILIVISILFSKDIVALAISYLLYSIYVFYISSKKLNYHLSFSLCGIRNHFCTASPYAAMVILNVALVTLDVLLLKIYGTLDELASYQVFARINVGMLIVFNVFFSVALPRVTSLIAKGNWSGVNKLHVILFSLSIFISAIYWVFDEHLLSLLFSHKYIDLARYSLVIVDICIIKYGYWFAAELILISTGNQLNRLKGYGIGVSISLVVYFFSVKYFALNGLIFANLFGVFFISSIYFFYSCGLWCARFKKYRVIEFCLSSVVFIFVILRIVDML